ncbi:MAG: YidC/Oxa1 family membrane protein insertase [Ruminococcaceae bacterium]|nr:YidC/Oxa1 family membrane protein insertase [Oscillospiraceae bacterium]
MEVIGNLLSYPFALILSFFYGLFRNYGFALIVFTIIIKVILIPLGIKQQKSSLNQMKFQPKMKEIQQKYANNKQKQSEEMQKLYQEEGFSPFGGCLPMLIQLPIILILYNIIRNPLTNICAMTASKINTVVAALANLGVTIDSKDANFQIKLAEAINENFDSLMSAGALPENFSKIDFSFFGINLSQTPSLSSFNLLLLIPLFACLTGFLVGIISQKFSAVQATGGTKMLLLMSPLLSLIYTFMFPAGVGLYWIMSNITAAVQSYVLGKIYNPREYAEKLKAEEEEKKRAQKQAIKDKRAKKFAQQNGEQSEENKTVSIECEVSDPQEKKENNSDDK